MSATYICFIREDYAAVLEALQIAGSRHIWDVDNMRVMRINKNSFALWGILQDAGISHNFAEYTHSSTGTPKYAGQIRFGHDGTRILCPLVPDLNLACAYQANLSGIVSISAEDIARASYVCCGQESWDNREENGQMHKMRNLLSQ